MYRKNTSGQFLSVQLLLTATGAVATGLTPSMRRCIDGTFAAGGGTFTEDGSTGAYKYAMTQADTNGNDIQFIVSATGAIPVCLNIVTTAADPTDGVRLGLTALPNAAAGANGGLPTGNASGQVVVSSHATGAIAAASFAAGAIDNAAIATDAIGSAELAASAVTEIQTGLSTLDAAGVRTAVGLASANIDTQLSAIAGYIDTEVAAIKAKTDNLPASPAATSDIPTAIQNADALLARNVSGGSSTGRTVKQALHFLRNKWTISVGTLTVFDTDDTTSSWTATVGTDAAAIPIVSNDPA